MAARLATCNRVAALGDVCARADSSGTTYVAACASEAGAETLACAKEQDDGAVAVCMTLADASASARTLVQCDGGSADSLARPPSSAGSVPGVCCGPNVLASMDSAVSECCPWQVDWRGQCCAFLDACGLCNVGSASRDAEGASSRLASPTNVSGAFFDCSRAETMTRQQQSCTQPRTLCQLCTQVSAARAR